MSPDPTARRYVEPSTAAAAALVDGAVTGRAVVVGSLPPDARDLDLLVCFGDEAAAVRALRAAGFVARDQHWALFAECSAVEVELVPTRRCGLAAAALESLFSESVPLPGLEHLRAPAPHHRLLLGATSLLGRSGYLAPRHGARMRRVVEEHPDAWAQAERQAAEWGAGADLARLGRALGGTRSPPARRALGLVRRVRGALRPQVIAISGIDGSGKSLQARALVDTLERLGHPAGTVWAPLASEAWLDRLARPVKGVLARVPRRRARGSGAGSARRGSASTPGRELRQQSPTLTSAWATIVAVANAWSLGRSALGHGWAGRVVVADRYHLDSAVRMRFYYGEKLGFGLQRRLVGALSPRARRAFFLDVTPVASAARKDDGWTTEELAVQARLYREEHLRFGAVRLDGERSPAEVCAEVGERTWRALR